MINKKLLLGGGIIGATLYFFRGSNNSESDLNGLTSVGGGGGIRTAGATSTPETNTLAEAVKESVSQPATESKISTSTKTLSGSNSTPANANYSKSTGGVGYSPAPAPTTTSTTSSGTNFINSLTSGTYTPSPSTIIKNHTKYSAKEVSDALKAEREA